jgi:hypothetical protein
MTTRNAARLFRLVRDEDVTGVSGTGVVADGVQWPDRSVTVRWRGEWPTVQHHDRGMDSAAHIHGHGGATRIEWADLGPNTDVDMDMREARRWHDNAAQSEAEGCDAAQVASDWRAAGVHIPALIAEIVRLRAVVHGEHVTRCAGVEWRRENLSFLRDRDIPSPDGPAHDALHRWRVHLGGTSEACAWRLEREQRVGWPSIRSAPNGLQVHVREVDGECGCAETGALAPTPEWCRACGKIYPHGTPHDDCDGSAKVKA